MEFETSRLAQQLQFILELDRLKTILRRSFIVDGTRHENTAEHSWHLAIMALVLAEHVAEPTDTLHAVKLVLIHDIVEIDAGDTYSYDEQANLDKADREMLAAQRLFGLLPPDQREMFQKLWEEFEAQETPEARFANAIDRLQPLLLNYHSPKTLWRDNQIRRAQVEKRMEPISRFMPGLQPEVERMILKAVETGLLIP
jgi:putative hydrolases of HD superfamily